MGRSSDKSGERFGALVVLKRVEDRTEVNSGKKRTVYECRCACGKLTLVLGDNLSRGRTKSCGCKIYKHW